MHVVTNALASKVAQTIELQDISVREAAKRCGIGLGLMTNVLYGRTQRPMPETLEALANGLGLTYRELALAAYGLVADPASDRVPAAV
jgi:transcriptional regulator with XRE-family HTH domain